MTRRTLLTLGGAAGVVALARPAGAATAVSGVHRNSAGAAGIGLRSSFAAVVGRTFMVSNGGGSHRLVLEKILDVDRTTKGSAHSFNLIFRQADKAEFVEGIYQLPTGWLSRTPLLLTPVGAAGPHRRIQALINRGS